LRRTLALVFSLVGHLGFELRVRGLEHFSNSPSTLIVCNHKTDFDIVLLAPMLYWSHRGRGPIAQLAFVAAERMFQPAYFSDYLLPRPRWISRPLYPVNLSGVLKALHAYPIPRAYDRKLGAHLRQILTLKGDLPLEAVFREEPHKFLPGVSRGARISEALQWIYHEPLYVEHPFSIVTPPLERELKAHHVNEILTSLARFAAILDEGQPVFLAPEGDLSPDGSFGEIRAALSRIVQMAEREPVLLPVNFTYDFMTSGRKTAFLTIGPELRGVKDWERERLERHVERTISLLGTVTLGQLAAEILRLIASQGRSEIGEGELKAQIQHEATRLAFKEGCLVDERLLQAKAFERRWSRFAAYCWQKGLLRWRDDQISFEHARVLGSALAETVPINPWVYSANELNDIITAHAMPEPAQG
jgi:1-acyl-sn-glycerol-3-phosphate acyltransferase